MQERARNGCNNDIGWKLLDIAGNSCWNGLKWLEIAGNGWNSDIGWKWLEMAGNGWKWLEMS